MDVKGTTKRAALISRSFLSIPSIQIYINANFNLLHSPLRDNNDNNGGIFQFSDASGATIAIHYHFTSILC